MRPAQGHCAFQSGQRSARQWNPRAHSAQTFLTIKCLGGGGGGGEGARATAFSPRHSAAAAAAATAEPSAHRTASGTAGKSTGDIARKQPIKQRHQPPFCTCEKHTPTRRRADTHYAHAHRHTRNPQNMHTCVHCTDARESLNKNRNVYGFGSAITNYMMAFEAEPPQRHRVTRGTETLEDTQRVWWNHRSTPVKGKEMSPSLFSSLFMF